MTDRELMQQALEALEQVVKYFNVDSTETKTIIALRERLAQPDPVPYWHSEFLKHNTTSEQPAQQQEWVACRDEMCACRGGPCASCPDGEREKELADMRDSRDFYKRRTDELQKAQSQMRDPERTMVCDILANGRLLVPAAGRYNTSPPASKSWVGLTDEERGQVYANWRFNGSGSSNLELCRAIEAKLREKNA